MRQQVQRRIETADCAVRWNVTRLYERLPGEEGGERSVHLTLHRAVPGVAKRLLAGPLEELRCGAAEERSWWEREQSVEGWVPEAILVRVLAERNALPLDHILVDPQGRQLAEDMVLLQLLGDEKPWTEAVAVYDEGRGDLPDLTGLAREQGGRWIDITQVARRAAKIRYQRALREGEVKPGGGYASER